MGCMTGSNFTIGAINEKSEIVIVDNLSDLAEGIEDQIVEIISGQIPPNLAKELTCDIMESPLFAQVSIETETKTETLVLQKSKFQFPMIDFDF